MMFATAQPNESPVPSAKDPSQSDPSTNTWPRPPHSKGKPGHDGLDERQLNQFRATVWPPHPRPLLPPVLKP